MAPSKGNQFWKRRSKHGRDKIFSSAEILWDAACEYFNWCDRNPLKKVEAIKSGELAGKTMIVKSPRPYTLQGLCIFLHVNTAYFRQFNETTNDDFSTIIRQIEDIIFTQKFDYGAIGVFNQNLISRSLGLIDKQSTELSGVDGTPLFDNISDQELDERILQLQNKANGAQ